MDLLALDGPASAGLACRRAPQLDRVQCHRAGAINGRIDRRPDRVVILCGACEPCPQTRLQPPLPAPCVCSHLQGCRWPVGLGNVRPRRRPVARRARGSMDRSTVPDWRAPPAPRAAHGNATWPCQRCLPRFHPGVHPAVLCGRAGRPAESAARSADPRIASTRVPPHSTLPPASAHSTVLPVVTPWATGLPVPFHTKRHGDRTRLKSAHRRLHTPQSPTPRAADSSRWTVRAQC